MEPLERRDLPAATLPAYLSAVGFGATGPNSTLRANAVATDPAGNTVVTGSFRGTATFGTATAGATFTTSNTQDTFVARFGPTGSLLWARTFAGRATTTATGSSSLTTYATGQGSAIALDAAGNVFLAGSFTGSVNFGTAASPALMNKTAGNEAYVAKLDNLGNLAWVRHVDPSTGDDQAQALALDGQGGVVVAGTFTRTVAAGSTTVAATGASEAFVTRFDIATATASWIFGTQGTAGSNAQATGVAVDASGDIVLAGFYSGTVILGSGTSGWAYTAAGSTDALVWKLDPRGKFLWARSFGSSDYDAASGVTVDASNQIAIVGAFSNSVNFATDGPADVLTAGPIFDTFVVKLDSTGRKVWARGIIGSTGWTRGLGIVADSLNRLHVAGAFSGTVDFDSGPNVVALTSTGSTDAYLAGFDPLGTLLQVNPAGQTNFNTSLGVAVNPAGVVAVVGTYSGAIQFGPIAVPAAGLASSFVARVQTRPTAVPAAPVLRAASPTGPANITSSLTPAFDLIGVEAAHIARLLRDGVVVAERVGPGTLVDPGPVALGAHQYTTIQVSPADVASAASPATTVIFVAVAPVAPTNLGLLAADDSGTVGDGLTNVRTPRIVGQAGAGLTVQVLSPTGAILGATTAADDGSFVARLASLADGAHRLQAVALGPTGVASARSLAFDLTVLSALPATPGTPVLLVADDSGTVGDGRTNVRNPRVIGTVGVGLVVRLVNAANVVLGTATPSSGGTYLIAVGSNLADGTYSVRAIATDAAGNSSAPSAAMTLVIATAAPGPLAGPSLVAADDLGVKGDGMTSVRRPRLTGTASPGNRVDWLDAGGATVASTTAARDGSYLFQPARAFPNGTVSVFVRQVDPVGNAGSVGNAFRLTIRATTGDYFGDQKTDAAIFRPSNNTFYLLKPENSSLYTKPLAIPGDVPISGDFLGDGTGDIATYRPSSSTFFYFDIGTSGFVAQQWGTAGDIPVPGDYDGDGKTDIGIYRPSTATFDIQYSSGPFSSRKWGATGDIPVPGDYFGNGSTDIALFRPSTATYSVLDIITGATMTQQWGSPNDIPVPGDYDGDGKTDFGIFRPNSATYAIQFSTGPFYSKAWGIGGDIPVAGDYFGNGRASLAVYRPSTSTFLAVDPINGAVLVQQWGTANDKPIQPPLTTHFRMGGLNQSTSGSPGARSLDPLPTFAALEPPAGATVPTTTKLAKATVRVRALDRAIADLGLERWRVDQIV